MTSVREPDPAGFYATALRRAALLAFVLTWAVASSSPPLAAQTFANGQCSVSVLNQTAAVQPDGTWLVPNVPANLGPVRARVTCTADGETLQGASELFEVVPDRMNGIPRIPLGQGAATPESIRLELPVTRFDPGTTTTRATVTARFADGSTRDVTAADGTVYVTSNAEVVEIGPDGRVSALRSGRVLVTALHEAVAASVLVTAVLSEDSDGDGLPDDLELALGLDPNDPADALEDLDGDGLANLAEFELGTRIDRADSDGDRLADGEEIAPGADGFLTDPLLADTDGDGVGDGLEVEVGTNPTDPASVDYAAVLVGLTVEPGAFTLVRNTILPDEIGRRLTVTGHLVDGSEADLTARPQTGYATSDPAVAGFGAEPGRVVAGADGVATVTASLAGRSASSEVRVTSFSPEILAFLPIPGFANGVALADGLAFVAAGATGLQVVDLSNPAAPFLAGSLDTAGNANDLRVGGDLVYLADGERGLLVIDAAVPVAPVLLGVADTAGVATDLVVAGDRVYVADGPAGLAVVDVTDPAAPRLLAQLALPGDSRGIDAAGGLAVVAAGLGGVHAVDVSDPAAPRLAGSVHTRVTTSRAADVVLRDRLAYVADGSDRTLGGVVAVDLSDPETPVVIGASSERFGLTGLALDRNVALGADFFFVNAVPFFDLRPRDPAFTGAIDLFAPPAFREDNATAVAARGGLLAMTGASSPSRLDHGTAGDTGLHLARYALLGDELGVAPELRLVSPFAGQRVLERRPVFLRALGSDDLLLDSVRFSAGGEPVASLFSPPFEASFTPLVPGELEVRAVATDLGGNRTEAAATVTVVADGAPTAQLASPLPGSRVTEGGLLPIAVTATDDVGVASVEILVDGAVVGRPAVRPFRVDHPVPVGARELTVFALVRDGLGQTAVSEAVTSRSTPTGRRR